MFTRQNSWFRLASLSMMTILGAFAAGCGDDAAGTVDGGSGGSGGQAGDASTDRGDLRLDGDAGGGDGSVEAPEGGRACYNVSFEQPTDMTTLTAADDKDGDSCVNGFQYDVTIKSTDAPNGTTVLLYAGASMLASTQFTNGTATFASVRLSAMDDTVLSVQFPTTQPCTDPSAKAMITVNCDVPTCTLAKPLISGAHPALNGVPAPMGDRSNAVGSPFQTAFEVTTDIEDGRPVELRINNMATPATITTSSANAMGGKATFTGVTLSPDATYEVVAVCTAANGAVGTSMKGIYPVDTTAPDLTISSPMSGAFLGPAELTAGKFKVCAKTASTDAVNLAPSLGSRAANLCIANSTNCVALTAVNTDGCVDVTCPGGTPFNIDVTLGDTAGNTVTKTITGVACASTLPTVQIVSPVSDAPTFIDKTKHILAADAAGATQAKDLDGTVAGAQANVVACADRSGSATLFVGRKGDAALIQAGAAVATTAAASGECPSGLGFVAKFNSVTLPESINDAAGVLATATELRVDLTDVSTATGSSGLLDIWVDAIAPVISLSSPAGLCGSFQQAAATTMTTIVLNSDTPNVALTVTNGASTDTYANPTSNGTSATFNAVTFSQGQNGIAATATDPAGNSTAFAPAPCTVTVGAAPVVLFTTPVAGNNLCPAGSVVPGCIADSDVGVAGWQGLLTVRLTRASTALANTNVTFSVGATTLGTATSNATGDASLAITTNAVPEGNLTITATTDDVVGSGVGVGTVSVNVDTVPPGTPTGISAAVLDRRQSSFQLIWTATSDPTGATVAGYDVRVAKVPIDSTNFDDTAIATVVPYSGTPAMPGQLDGVAVTDLGIEQDYYFAVAAKDIVGSRGGILASTSPIAARFTVTILTGLGVTDGIGHSIDGSGDFGRPAGLSFTADGLTDLLVGAVGGQNVYAYFGSVTGYPATPSITISFPASTMATILNVAAAGDVDGDGLDDIAVSSSTENKIFIYSRKNPPVSWGSTTSWPATLTDTQANYVITAGGTFAGTLSTRPLTRIGNFDGMGSDDLAIGFSPRATQTGAVVILKGSSTFGSTTLPDAANSYEIVGGATLTLFGSGVVPIGRFYPAAVGPTILITAPRVGTAYAYSGQVPGGVLSTTDAVDSVTYPTTSLVVGFMGPLGASPGAVTVASTTSQFVDVHLGTVATGPFLGTPSAPAASVRFIDPAAPTAFGVVNVGGGVRGTSATVSVIGDDAIPDLIVAGQGEANNPVYVISGAAIPAMSGSVNVAAAQPALVPDIVKISGQVPGGWGGYTHGVVILDGNGDGKGDFAVGENGFGKVGRVVVFH